WRSSPCDGREQSGPSPDHEGDAGEPKMKVGRPTAPHPLSLHEEESHQVGQCQVLVRELAEVIRAPPDLLRACLGDAEHGEVIDEGQELERLESVMAPQEPGMPFRDHEPRCQEPWWSRE